MPSGSGKPCPKTAVFAGMLPRSTSYDRQTSHFEGVTKRLPLIDRADCSESARLVSARRSISPSEWEGKLVSAHSDAAATLLNGEAHGMAHAWTVLAGDLFVVGGRACFGGS